MPGENETRRRPARRGLEMLALAAVAALGLAVRVDDLGAWRAEPALAMHGGAPLLRGSDGYYYLRLARDLVEGTYAPVDAARAVPDSPPRPWPPPLLAVAGAAIARTTPLPLAWVGALLPALLGILVVVPLWALGRRLDGPAMGLAAAAVAVVSESYAGRSGLGWFDTDCLNVTWAVAAAACFLGWGTAAGARRWVHLGAGLAVYALFLWWWDTAPAVVTGATGLPLAAALVLLRPRGRRGALVLVVVLAALAAAAVAWRGASAHRALEGVRALAGLVGPGGGGDFPNVGRTISELERQAPAEVMRRTAGSVPAFALAVLGLAWLAARRPRESAVLAALLLLGALGFSTAQRFEIFLAPLVALGLGQIVARLWALRARHAALGVLAPALVAALVVPVVLRHRATTLWPEPAPGTVPAMAEIAATTPPDAVVWAWWDAGYLLQFWARRATVTDGGAQGAERSVYAGIPLATGDPRLAANFTAFFVARGRAGMERVYDAVGGDRGRGLGLVKDVLAAGPGAGRDVLAAAGLAPADEWLAFFFPAGTRPVYLFLDERLTRTAYWWFWLGSWDPARRAGVHPRYEGFYPVAVEGTTVRAGDELTVDLPRGTARYRGAPIALGGALVVERGERWTKAFGDGSGPRFEVDVDAAYGALMDESIAVSTMNRLFLRQDAPAPWFRLVASAPPLYQLWEVRGDAVAPADLPD